MSRLDRFVLRVNLGNAIGLGVITIICLFKADWATAWAASGWAAANWACVLWRDAR